MAKKSKFVLNRKGVSELLKGEEMKSLLNDIGSKVKSKAGVGYEAEVVQSSDRAKTIVSAKSKKAKRDNLKNNTLLKALK